MAALVTVQINANINDRGMSVETMAATLRQSLVAHGWTVNGSVKVNRPSINVRFYDQITVVCTIHSTLDLATLREWFISNLQTEGFSVGGVTITILSTTAAGKKSLGTASAPKAPAATTAPAPVVTADSATLQAILAKVSAPAPTSGGSFNSFAAGLGVSAAALGVAGGALVLLLVLSRR